MIFGKGPGGQSVPNDATGHAAMWKKKSIFWELPYWKVLEVRSAIDVMHVMKNLCVGKVSGVATAGMTLPGGAATPWSSPLALPAASTHSPSFPTSP